MSKPKERKCPQHPDETEVWSRRKRCFVCSRCEENILNHDAGDCDEECIYCVDEGRTVPGLKTMGWKDEW